VFTAVAIQNLHGVDSTYDCCCSVDLTYDHHLWPFFVVVLDVVAQLYGYDVVYSSPCCSCRSFLCCFCVLCIISCITRLY
jgi:hypothetical protein